MTSSCVQSQRSCRLDDIWRATCPAVVSTVGRGMCVDLRFTTPSWLFIQPQPSYTSHGKPAHTCMSSIRSTTGALPLGQVPAAAALGSMAAAAANAQAKTEAKVRIVGERNR